MGTLLVLLGAIFVVVGVVIFLIPSPRIHPSAESERGIQDVAKLMEEINKLLDKFDKRYRPGLVVILVGMTLVALGVYVETRQDNNAAKPSATAFSSIQGPIGSSTR